MTALSIILGGALVEFVYQVGAGVRRWPERRIVHRLPPARVIRGDVVARPESEPRVVRVPMPPWLPGSSHVDVPIDETGSPVRMPVAGPGVPSRR